MKNLDDEEIVAEKFTDWYFDVELDNSEKLSEIFIEHLPPKIANQASILLEKIEHEAACQGAAVMYESFIKEGKLSLFGGEDGSLSLYDSELGRVKAFNLQEMILDDISGLGNSGPALMVWAKEFERLAVILRLEAEKPEQAPDPYDEKC